MNSVSFSSASRRAMLLRAFFTAIALAFVQFVPSDAFALGTVTLATKEPDESDGRWKLVFTINYGSTPHLAHIPMIFSFTPTVLYERSLTDQSPEKPVLTRIPLQNQISINESMDVGFSNSDGKIYSTTKFDFVIKRAKGFEAGEYDLKITRSDDGAQMGQTIKLKLKGDNTIVDRRAMVFSGEKKKKPEEKKDDKAEEKKDGEGSGEGSSAANDSSGSSSETPTEAPPATPPKQGGCGCRVVAESTESPLGLAALIMGAAIVARRRRR
ncbi:MAG TPA: MYXO-CTERM sorting domain-containing protein [Polyangium sp.]|nr:MYXO-CTERM sorting domain-containing protein [Polyangium sp.]